MVEAAVGYAGRLREDVHCRRSKQDRNRRMQKKKRGKEEANAG
jgi:hypothetical protein